MSNKQKEDYQSDEIGSGKSSQQSKSGQQSDSKGQKKNEQRLQESNNTPKDQQNSDKHGKSSCNSKKYEESPADEESIQKQPNLLKSQVRDCKGKKEQSQKQELGLSLLNDLKKKTLKFCKLTISLKKVRNSPISKAQKIKFLQKISLMIRQNNQYELYQKSKHLFREILQRKYGHILEKAQLVSLGSDKIKCFGEDYLTEIPPEIAHINFPSLRIINLSDNKITNIEALTFIHAPVVKYIQLQDNFVYNWKSIVKNNFPLFFLTLDETPNLQSQIFSRLKSSNLACLDLVIGRYRLQYLEYSFLFKLEPHDTRQLNQKLYSQYKQFRRMNIKIRNCLKINPSVQIYNYQI